jgi:hypothetical protein
MHNLHGLNELIYAVLLIPLQHLAEVGVGHLGVGDVFESFSELWSVMSEDMLTSRRARRRVATLAAPSFCFPDVSGVGDGLTLIF